jgi:hypothetical protein
VTTIATPPRRTDGLARAGARVAAGTHPAVWSGAGVLAIVAVSLWLRSRALDAGFWIDEGLSVGISSYPLHDVPSVLREDGSPPLYYLLLHLWMRAFGSGETATHTLSLLAATLTIPVAWWAGRTLFGVRAAWTSAALAAINPFLTYYAQETRMYALSALLGLVVAATFLQAFAVRDRRFLAPFALALAATLYTHNWALFVAAGSVLALGALWRWTEPAGRRPLVRDALLAYGGVAVLYAPWLPTLAFQTRHTGAPWAERPNLEALLSSSGALLGGTTTAIALLLAAGSGVALLVRERLDRRMAALLVLTLGGIVVAWLASQISPAFATRYFAAFVGPLLLIAGAGLAVAGRLGLVCFLIVAAFWFDPRTSQIKAKSNVRSVAASIQTLVTAGDLVVSTHPEQLPLLSYYLPQGVRYGDALGPVEDPRVFDWTDALRRLKTARPTPTSDRMVRTLSAGQELVLIEPILRTGRWGAPWTSLVRRRTVQWERVLDRDTRLRREAVVPVFGFDPLPRGVRAVVYRRVGPPH